LAAQPPAPIFEALVTTEISNDKNDHDGVQDYSQSSSSQICDTTKIVAEGNNNQTLAGKPMSGTHLILHKEYAFAVCSN
jgi:hypothetical protein